MCQETAPVIFAVIDAAGTAVKQPEATGSKSFDLIEELKSRRSHQLRKTATQVALEGKL